MDTWLAAAIMGVVEGLTEFIPVSSTGHLILAGELLRFDGRLSQTFEIFIQCGAILAVVVAYPGRFADLCDLRRREGFAGPRGLGLLALTTLPAVVLGLLLHGFIEERLFGVAAVAAGLAAGGGWILLAERRRRPARIEALEEIGWREALAIGCFQCLALWPGVSRSVSTILGAMALGVGRRAATEYSFFAAVPVLTLASLYALIDGWPLLIAADLPVLLVGLLFSFLFGWMAVRFLIRFLSRHSLDVFGWYRLGLAGVVAVVLMQ